MDNSDLANDLFPLLSPMALAALEAGITDSLNETLSDDCYRQLRELRMLVHEQGHRKHGDLYNEWSDEVEEAMNDLPIRRRLTKFGRKDEP